MSLALDSGGTARRAQPGKFLTFFLGAEEYGIEILAVHEIIGMLPVTRVPRTPPFVRGVVNLRGKVIPVIGLRERFGLAPADAETCIIVVEARGIALGVVVDRVSEVLVVGERDLDPPPAFGVTVHTEFLLGIAKGEGRVRLLLDLERVLTADEWHALPGAGAGGAGAPA